ncbi:MAG: macro domain-containing protein [Lachnospiraceae bacterium]|nr:macro domain-containing protein [Lachnospiraceae bacterium]
MAFKIIRNDITKMNTEAIVNTANDHPTVGTGCDSAVYKAAGYDELLAYRTEKIGFVPEGDAFITPGFNLQAKYIIHAVSPLYIDGNDGEEDKLRSCYRKSLQLAKENDIKSIAFPLISTGSFGYPKEEGMRIAADEINAFLLDNEMEIYLVVFDDKSKSLGERLYPEIEEYIDRNYVEEKHREEYGFIDSADAMPPMAMASMARAAVPDELCEDTAGFFEEEHESRLEERMKHISDTFSQYLMYLIQDKKMENAEVYRRAIVDKKIFSKIKNNKDYHPQKLTALCLCVGAKLNLDESKDLLARAGYALSPCDKTDIIFSYFIENAIYDMIELDIQLEEHGLPCIIS